MRGRIVLVGGGARSGKSAFALRRAGELGQRRLFVATAEAGDAAMRLRVERHRRERGDAFRTVEEPRDLAGALAAVVDADVVVIDCLTFWLANLLMDGVAEERILAETDRVVELLRRAPHATVVVTNEVGMGVHPETELGLRFRDVAGFAHQRLARAASEAYVGVMGVVLRLRPAPVEIVT